MFVSCLSTNNLSQKMLRVIFSIYLVVTCLVTSLQFLTEYLSTQGSIANELIQLEETVQGPISASLWQYNETQLDILVDGLLKMPIIEGVDVIDADAQTLISARSYSPDATPLSIFQTKSDLKWTLNEEYLSLGTLILYSSSEVVLDRVWVGFSLIVLAAIIKLSVLFWLFIWAFDRYLAIPLKELMSQVDEVQLDHNSNKRINLSNLEENELSQLQKHMNDMLSSIETDKKRLFEDEQTKRVWLEEEVEKRTQDLKLVNEKLKELAKKDSLTDTLNRGSFFETAQHLLDLSQRQKSSASLILMDLDHFKKINDTYGHFTGDKVLIHFTQTIHTFLRKSDLLGRLGGEEFAVLLCDTEIDNAFIVAEKIRKSVNSAILAINGNSVTYSVSMGIESSTPDEHSINELFKRADLKLYGAKDKGRDRVEK